MPQGPEAGTGKEGAVSDRIIAARYDFPLIELAPLAADRAATVEELVAGLPNTNPEITSAHFGGVLAAPHREDTSRLLLAKPLHDRQHLAREQVVRLLQEAGLEPADLPQLALLKAHTDELWEAGVRFVGALGARSVWAAPDGAYAVYLICNPADRGFHLHWLESEWGGPVWFLVRRKSR